MSTQRRTIAAGVALMLGGAGILLSAAPAQAAQISFRTECIPPAISGLPPVQGTTTVLVTAPATAKVGDTVEVVWKTVKPASKNPDMLDLAANTVKPTGTMKIGGAQSGTVAMEGPRQNPPIPKNTDMVLPEMKGTLKLTKAGDVTLTPDAYTINVSKPMSTNTTCTPKEQVPVGATIKVSADGGGNGGSGNGGGSDNGGSDNGGSDNGGSDNGGSGDGGSDNGGGNGGGGDGGRTDFPGKEVKVAFTCTSPGPASINSKVTIGAKKNGGAYDLTVKTAKGVMNSPAPLPANALTPSMDIKIGGDDSGTVKVTGASNPTALKMNDPVSLTDMKGTYRPGATGKATLSPGALTISVVLAPGADPIKIPCTVKGAVEASLTLDTAKQSGGTSGSTDDGGTDNGGTNANGDGGSGNGNGGNGNGGNGSGGGENLAETGAESDGALRALGLVAGTVILLGGALFTFTPWRRLARRER
ncbi:hypothetical protein ACFWIN_24475 [Streptomyces sp. NPDC127049]|uniref:hypothetical protein n=1 Tax=Streptomyces sp. NPDC127049 TaxID=3347118 RepID=UPI0036518A6D